MYPLNLVLQTKSPIAEALGCLIKYERLEVICYETKPFSFADNI